MSMDIHEQAFTFDGHKYTFDVNTHYGFTPNVEKLVVWDVNNNLIGHASIDHNMEQIHIEVVDAEDTSVNYFTFDDNTFDYQALATVVVAASY